jgi:hypothetical protein
VEIVHHPWAVTFLQAPFWLVSPQSVLRARGPFSDRNKTDQRLEADFSGPIWRIPLYEWPTYMANLCPILIVVSGRVSQTAMTILHSESADCNSVSQDPNAWPREAAQERVSGALR